MKCNIFKMLHQHIGTWKGVVYGSRDTKVHCNNNIATTSTNITHFIRKTIKQQLYCKDGRRAAKDGTTRLIITITTTLIASRRWTNNSLIANMHTNKHSRNKHFFHVKKYAQCFKKDITRLKSHFQKEHCLMITNL